MATTTKNYKLVKPDASDLYDIEVYNRNMDEIDEQLAVVYSTNETLTNAKWVDGKPIYRKVIYADKDTVPNEHVFLSTGIDNSVLSELVSFDGFYRTETSANRLGHVTNPELLNMGFAYTLIAEDSTELKIRVRAGLSSNTLKAGKYYFIVEYTKTAD